MGDARSTRVLAIEGTRLLLDGQPFLFQGLSCFNAIYNPTFNRSATDRLHWLRTFKENGVNALRVWCQWDFSARRVPLWTWRPATPCTRMRAPFVMSTSRGSPI